MKTVILCGGEGTRLREKTESIPKPLVEVGPQPILWHLMKGYAHHGFSEFVLCLGYKGRCIKDHFLDLVDDRAGDLRLLGASTDGPRVEQLRNHVEPWDIRFIDTGLKTDTGGRLHKVREYVKDETFSLTYADGVADLDLRALYRFHQSHGKMATVTAVRRHSTLGLMRIGDDNVVERFAEKPMMDSYINGGFFVFEPTIFEYTNDHCNLETDVLPRVVADGELRAFMHDGFWACMDTYKDNVLLTELWNQDEAPWKCW